MPIIDNRFLPMSLDDIVQAIMSLQNEVAEFKDNSSGYDDSALLTQIDELKNSINQFEDLQQQFSEFQAVSDSLNSLTERVDTLESSMMSISQSDSSEVSENDIQNISERVDALEDINNQFFGA